MRENQLRCHSDTAVSYIAKAFIRKNYIAKLVDSVLKLVLILECKLYQTGNAHKVMAKIFL